MIKKTKMMLVLTFFVLAGCSSKKSQSSENVEQTAGKAQELYPMLSALVLNKPKTKEPFELLIVALQQPIETEERLVEVVALRDTLASRLGALIAESDKSLEDIQKLEEEAKKLGIGFIYAEGMPLGAVGTTFIEDIVTKVASEPYALVLKTRHAYNDALGGEYPYADLSQHAVALDLAEKIIEKYPKSKWKEEIYDIYISLSRTFVDVHLAEGGGDETAIIGYATNDPYPGMSDLKFQREYLKAHPKSVVGKMLTKILENTSRVKTSESGIAPLFAIKIKEIEAEKAHAYIGDFYLSQGIDIPHAIWVGEKAWITYRYYPDSMQAVEQLPKILPKAPTAQVVRVPASSLESGF